MDPSERAFQTEDTPTDGLTPIKGRDSVVGVGNDGSVSREADPAGSRAITSDDTPGQTASRISVTKNQTSSLGFLRLILLGALLVPILAATGDAEILGASMPVPVSDGVRLLQAPPHHLMGLLGVLLVAFAVGRRVAKGSRG